MYLPRGPKNNKQLSAQFVSCPHFDGSQVNLSWLGPKINKTTTKGIWMRPPQIRDIDSRHFLILMLWHKGRKQRKGLFETDKLNNCLLSERRRVKECPQAGFKLYTVRIRLTEPSNSEQRRDKEKGGGRGLKQCGEFRGGRSSTIFQMQTLSTVLNKLWNFLSSSLEQREWRR